MELWTKKDRDALGITYAIKDKPECEWKAKNVMNRMNELTDEMFNWISNFNHDSLRRDVWLRNSSWMLLAELYN